MVLNRKVLVIGIKYLTQLIYSLIALISYIGILLTLISSIGYLLYAWTTHLKCSHFKCQNADAQ